jgi:hypothetical protein
MRTIVKFFEDMTGLVPTEDQKNLLHKAVTIEPQGRVSYNNILISAGFQSGKTLCSAVIVLWFVFEWAEENRPLKVILVSAQDNILYLHMRDMFRRNPTLSSKLSDKSQLGADLIPIKGFETQKGSQVFVRKSTEKSVLGIPADIVVVDEASRVKEDIILYCIGRLTGDIAKLIMLSTPEPSTSYFVRLVVASIKKEKEAKAYRLFMWSAEKLTWHNKEQEKNKLESYTKAQYASLVLGRPYTEDERTFFSSKHLEACLSEEDGSRVGGSKSTLECGIDFGFNSFTIVIRERIGATKTKVIFFKEWVRVPREEVFPEIAKILNTYKPEIIKADSKPVEYKGQIEKHTKRRIVYVDAGANDVVDGKEITNKAHMYGQLLRRVREHQLILPYPYTKPILDQMRVYRKNMRDGDDIVDALALACYEPSIPLLLEKVTMHFGGTKGGNFINNKKVDKYGFKQ